MDDIEVLLGTDLFAGITPAELGALMPGVQRHTLERGECFYRVGEPSTHAWVMVSGQGKMTMLTPDGDETVLDIILPGNVFGLPGLFSTTAHRVAESTATETCVGLSIERSALLGLLDRQPVLMRRVVTRLADLVREYAEALILSAHEDLRARLARRLLDLAGLHGEAGEQGVLIRAKVSQETLGAMIGASRAKVNRALAQLAADGALRVDAGLITLLDVERLGREHPDWFATASTPPVHRGA